MFRFRFKFLADSYLLLFSFFLGMIGAALFFWWRYPVFPSYLFYSHGITGNKNFTEAFLIVIKQRFFQLGAGWLCGLTVYSVWLFGILTCFWSFSVERSLTFTGNVTPVTSEPSGFTWYAEFPFIMPAVAFPSSPGDILSHGLVRSFQMVF